MLCERCAHFRMSCVRAPQLSRVDRLTAASTATRPITSSHHHTKSQELTPACRGQLQDMINEIDGKLHDAKPLRAKPLRSYSRATHSHATHSHATPRHATHSCSSIAAPRHQGQSRRPMVRWWDHSSFTQAAAHSSGRRSAQAVALASRSWPLVTCALSCVGLSSSVSRSHINLPYLIYTLI